MSEATAAVNGIEICYETFGDPDGRAAAARHGPRRPDDRVGRRVLRGASPTAASSSSASTTATSGCRSKIDSEPLDFVELFVKAQQGEPIDAPYMLTGHGRRRGRPPRPPRHRGRPRRRRVDGRDDRPDRSPSSTRSGSVTLTSIMSTTGDRDVGQPTPEAMQRLLRPPDRRPRRGHRPRPSRRAGSSAARTTSTRSGRARGPRRPTTAASTPSASAASSSAILASGDAGRWPRARSTCPRS